MNQWKVRILLVAAITIFAQQAKSDELSKFNQHFKLVKNSSGEVVAVNMRTAQSSFQLRPVVEHILTIFKEQLSRIKMKGLHGEQVLDEWEAEMLDGMQSFVSDEQKKDIRWARWAIDQTSEADLRREFNKVWGKGVLARFEVELKKAFGLASLSVLARLDDPKFFMKRRILYEVTHRMLGFAAKQFGNIPLLSVVQTIIIKTRDMLLEQRLFYQNMLLHYLQNYHESDLGLTKAEADHLFSSIYESRMSVFEFPQYRNIENVWDRFGSDRFYRELRYGSSNLYKSEQQYPYVEKRYNYAFAKVADEKGNHFIINLINKRHRFSSKLSVALDYANPAKVRLNRGLAQLAQVCLGFVPIPNFIKGQVDSFLSSTYVPQQRQEGALVGYLESLGDNQAARLQRQAIMNPFLRD